MVEVTIVTPLEVELTLRVDRDEAELMELLG